MTTQSTSNVPIHQWRENGLNLVGSYYFANRLFTDTCVSCYQTLILFYTTLYLGTEAFEKLCELLESTNLKKDVQKLSPRGQTSGIEGFHSIVNQSATKCITFPTTLC